MVPKRVFAKDLQKSWTGNFPERLVWIVYISGACRKKILWEEITIVWGWALIKAMHLKEKLWISVSGGQQQLSKWAGNRWCIWEDGSRRGLNNHSMSALAVEGPAGLVHCVNQSLEACWLHSSLVYFKAKGWAVFRGASTLPPYQQAGRFTQSQHSHHAAADASWATTLTWHLPFSTNQRPSCSLKYTSEASRLLSAYNQKELKRWAERDERVKLSCRKGIIK